MTRLSLKQLAQSGAANGQVPGWSTAAGMWVPTTVSGGGGGGGYATGVRQIVSTTVTGVSTTTTTMLATSSTPTSSQGAQFVSLSITPQSATSAILAFATIQASTSNINTVTAALFRDSTTSAIGAGSMACLTGTTSLFVVVWCVVPSSSTATTTFKLRAGPAGSGTLTVNGYGGSNQLLGAASATGIVLVEYGA